MKRFSIVHATNRPYGWQACYAQYLRRAVDPKHFEYLLICDECDLPQFAGFQSGNIRVIPNIGDRSYVAAANYGVQFANAPVVLMATDDMFPPTGWDVNLWDLFTSESEKHVAWVNDGVFPHIMTMQIFTRTWYDRYGYVFKPAYGSMLGDQDFTRRAIRDGVVMDVRTDPEFRWQHFHHRAGTRPLDSSDAVNQSADRYVQGWTQFVKDWPDVLGGKRLIDVIYESACSTPSDINEHLPTLKSLVEGKRVLELGVRTGNSTAAFLAGNPKRLVSVDIDLSRLDPEMIAAGKMAGVNWELRQQDSREPIDEEFDVVFFDTLHTEAHLAAEIAAHVKGAQTLIFHDVVANRNKGEDGGPGLFGPIVKVVERGGYEWVEMQNNNGLGIVSNTGEDFCGRYNEGDWTLTGKLQEVS